MWQNVSILCTRAWLVLTGGLGGQNKPVLMVSITFPHPSWGPDSLAVPAVPGLSLLPAEIILLGRDKFKMGSDKSGKKTLRAQCGSTSHVLP